MDIDAAYKLLGLSDDASEEEVKKAYREASKESHPDTATGSDDGQKAINEARKTILSYLDIREAVVPASPQSLSRYIDHAIARYAGPTSREEADRVQRIAVRPIQRVKRLAWGCGALTGMMVLLEKLAPTLLGLDENASQTFTGTLTTVAAVFGLMGLALQLVVAWHKNHTEAAIDRLSDRRTCAQMLAQSLDFRDVASFQERDMHRAGVNTTVHTPFPFSLSCDLQTVLLRKAIEHQLVSIERPDEMTPSYAERYQLTFDPSLFQSPPPKPSTLTRPPTKRERWTGIGYAVALLASALGLAGYLHFSVHTHWALLPLILGVLLFFGGVAAAFEERTEQTPEASTERMDI